MLRYHAASPAIHRLVDLLPVNQASLVELADRDRGTSELGRAH